MENLVGMGLKREALFEQQGVRSLAADLKRQSWKLYSMYADVGCPAQQTSGYIPGRFLLTLISVLVCQSNVHDSLTFMQK